MNPDHAKRVLEHQRIREIAQAYAANAGEVDKLAAAIADLVRDEREACAKIVEGEIYKERYRTWPRVGTGNRARESEVVAHCIALSEAIRARKP